MGFKVTVLGSSGGYPGAGRACSGYLFQNAEGNLVVDLGSIATKRPLLQRSMPSRIRILCQSHRVLAANRYCPHESALGILASTRITSPWIIEYRDPHALPPRHGASRIREPYRPPVPAIRRHCLGRGGICRHPQERAERFLRSSVRNGRLRRKYPRVLDETIGTLRATDPPRGCNVRTQEEKGRRPASVASNDKMGKEADRGPHRSRKSDKTTDTLSRFVIVFLLQKKPVRPRAPAEAGLRLAFLGGFDPPTVPDKARRYVHGPSLRIPSTPTPP